MRLGAYPAVLQARQPVSGVMAGQPRCRKRHRHRNVGHTCLKDRLDSSLVSQALADGVCRKSSNMRTHPGSHRRCKFHPELKSRPFRAASVVLPSFVEAAMVTRGGCMASMHR